MSPTAGVKQIRLSEKGQRPALGLINNLGRAQRGEGSTDGGNTPGGADSDKMPGNDVLYGFKDELRRQMTNLAPNQTIFTDNNMNSYMNNPESPEKDQPKPY